jgi:hypothetical protein
MKKVKAEDKAEEALLVTAIEEPEEATIAIDVATTTKALALVD